MSIWKEALDRRAVDIETVWLILLGVVLCGSSMPVFWSDLNTLIKNDLYIIWFRSVLMVFTIASLVTIISTLVIYGYEVWYLYRSSKLVH